MSSPNGPICLVWLGGVAEGVDFGVAATVEALHPGASTVEDTGVVARATLRIRRESKVRSPESGVSTSYVNEQVDEKASQPSIRPLPWSLAPWTG